MNELYKECRQMKYIEDFFMTLNIFIEIKK